MYSNLTYDDRTILTVIWLMALIFRALVVIGVHPIFETVILPNANSSEFISLPEKMEQTDRFSIMINNLHD